MKSVTKSTREQLAKELENFEEIARGVMPRPGSVPSVTGVEVYGETVPLNGIVGGDHIIYVDFNKRHDMEARIKVAAEAGRSDIVANLEYCRRTAGVLLMDVSGHQATDAMLAAMFHQAFLIGVLYELDMFGHVTQKIFENLNQRFYRTTKVEKYMTAVYGEISEDATFRFLLAGHPPPIVFSAAKDRFMEVDREKCIAFPPIGTIPSKSVVDWHRSKSLLGFKDPYELNKWELMGSGDILLLYTDGVEEHMNGETPYFPDRLEHVIRKSKHLSAKEIVHTVLDDVQAFAKPADDLSLVVIKKL
jgi:serine phosphatase RsbU (regulator of sigma subunit)